MDKASCLIMFAMSISTTSNIKNYLYRKTFGCMFPVYNPPYCFRHMPIYHYRIRCEGNKNSVHEGVYIARGESITERGSESGIDRVDKY